MSSKPSTSSKPKPAKSLWARLNQPIELPWSGSSARPGRTTSTSTAGGASASSRDAKPPRRVISRSDLEFLIRQLASLLQSGVPLERAVYVLAEQQTREPVKERLHRIRSRLREGVALHLALGEYSNDFPDNLRALVAVGESSGSLPAVLDQVASSMASANALRVGVMSALAYPAIVTFVALLVVFALMAYVVPEIVSALEGQRQSLPLLTRILVFVSAGVEAYGLWVLIGLVIILTTLTLWVQRSETARLGFDRLMLALPFVGRMLRDQEAARLASTLAISLSGGVSLVRALQSSQEAVRNRDLRGRLRRASQWVREGAELGRSLERVGGYPALLVQLVSTGERSSQLPRMLDLAARQLNDSLRQRSFLLTSFLEPALILVMGMIVLVIVLAVMMPLIEMNTLLK